MSDPAWLPALMQLDDYGGDWHRYLEAVYAKFHNDFIRTQPKFQECWVRCRLDPLELGKEAGFWHCTSGGKNESQRTPELRRMERIQWVRAILDHPNDVTVDIWEASRGTDIRWCLWFREEYLVVLADRVRKRDGFRYLQLITAYDTPYEHRKKRLREERDAWKAKNG